MDQVSRRIVFVFCLVVAASCSVDAQVRAEPDKDSENILSMVENTPDPKIKIESVTGFPKKSSLVTNSAKTYKAYILCIPVEGSSDKCSARVFITEIATGKTYMIKGEEDGIEYTRPVDSLRWVDDDRVSYDRWMNPNFGHRYFIEVKQKKQTAAFIVFSQGR